MNEMSKLILSQCHNHKKANVQYVCKVSEDSVYFKMSLIDMHQQASSLDVLDSEAASKD